MAERRWSEFNAQNLASAAWALVIVEQPFAKLITLSVRHAEQRLSRFNGQNLARALATAKRLYNKLSTVSVKHTQWRLGEFNVQTSRTRHGRLQK